MVDAGREGGVLRRPVRGPDRSVRDAVGEHPHRRGGLATRGPRRMAQGGAARRPRLPAIDPDVVTAHLSGEVHLGLYPLLDGDRSWWLAADFDGQAAMLDALAYLKAARAVGVPEALEISRSGVGAHIWIFFTEPVAATVARKRGSGLLRETMA